MPEAATTKEGTSYSWQVLSVTCLGATLVGLNGSTMDVALPSVTRHFDASASEASWILLSYLLVNTSLLLIFGKVADIVGRRRLYLLGLGLFTLSSALCGLAPSAVSLAGLRGLQAVGAAALITNVTALLADVFPPRLLSTALGLNVTATSTAQMVGPLAGGALVGAFGWRAAFWFNVPVGVVGLLWGLRMLRPDPPKEERKRFDLLGALLSWIALAGLVECLSQGGSLGWSSTPVVVGGLLFVLALPFFLLVERARMNPMLDLTLFADRERSLAYFAGFAMAAARFAVVLIISIYVQAATGATALQAGLRVLPVALGLAGASAVSGRLARRWGARTLCSTGLAIAATGLLVLAFTLQPRMPGSLLAGCLLAVGIGTGLFMTPNTNSIMANASASQRGMANGVRSATQNVGFVVSTSLSLAIITSWLSPEEKRAAYDGTLSRLSLASVNQLGLGYRVALIVMAGFCVAGLIASLSRNPPLIASAAKAELGLPAG